MAIGTPITAATDGTTVVEVDPISRIEGHLGVKVTDRRRRHHRGRRPRQPVAWFRELPARPRGQRRDHVHAAYLRCLPGSARHDLDLRRRCGSRLQPRTTSRSLTTAPTVCPPRRYTSATSCSASEFLMSSITHFYHLAAPSYVQGPPIPPWTPYFNSLDYNSAAGERRRRRNERLPATPDAAGFSDDLWSAVITSYVTALRVRRLTFEAGALFAGRMPMTSCFVGGGVTNNDTTTELQDRCDKFRDVMEEVGTFVVQRVRPDRARAWCALRALDNVNNAGGLGYGAGVGNFLAWGAFPNPADDTLALPGGVLDSAAPAPQRCESQFKVANKAQVLATSVRLSGTRTAFRRNLKEDITNSRYKDSLGEYDANNQAYPGAVTRTEPDRANGYTYSKAPRWDGNPCEVGPFARLVIAGYYPIDGTALALTVPGYGAYTKIVNGTNRPRPQDGRGGHRCRARP